MQKNTYGVLLRAASSLLAMALFAVAANAAPAHESGTLTFSQSNATTWQTLTFSETYATPPIVVMGPLTTNVADHATIRVRNVTTTGCEYQQDEYEYEDGSHGAETIGYFVLEEGVHSFAGFTWEAGRRNVGTGYSTTTLTATFANAPVVLTQVESGSNEVATDDTISLNVRNRTVTTTSFQSRIMAQEGTSGLVAESVGYIAVSTGTGLLDGRPITVFTTPDTVTHTNYAVDFGAEYRNATILGSQQTTDGGDNCSIRIRNVTSTGLDAWLEEDTGNDTETAHTTESLGFLIQGEPLGEADSKLELLSVVANHNWKTVNFTETYTNPVVVVGPPTYAGADKSTVRVQAVTSTSCQVQVDEWEYRDGGHANETMSLIVMEAGVYEMGGLRWQAGAVDGVTNGTSAVTLVDEMPSVPVLLGQVVTVNEPTAVVHRFDNATTAGFNLLLQEEEGAASRAHLGETVHYIAIEQGEGLFTSIGGVLFNVAATTQTISDVWEQITFPNNHAAPLFLADMPEIYGSDPIALRYRNLFHDRVEVFVEEEQSGDDEIGHANEIVNYLIAATAIDTDQDGMGDDWETLHGLDPNDPSDADLDPDNDLLTNAEEFLFDYDPYTFSGGDVRVQIVAADGYEKEGTPSRVRIHRANGRAAINVSFTVTGTASGNFLAASAGDFSVTRTNGTALSGSITIPQNSTSIDIFIAPVADGVAEYPENVRTALVANADYDIVGASSGNSRINDATDIPDNENVFVGVYRPELTAQGITSASGVATLIINGNNTEARITTSFSGLTSNQSAAHIHYANASAPNSVAGPAVYGLPQGQNDNVIWDVIPDAGYNGQELINALYQQNGLFLYANVHTAEHPGGEIRAKFRLTEGEYTGPPPPPPTITTLTGDDLTRDCARFLTQATFGPTQAEITALVDKVNNEFSGDRIAAFDDWIEDQFALDQTSLHTITYAADQQEWVFRGTSPYTYNDNSNDPDQHNRRREQWTIWTKAHDQLRQRVGFALYEIFVISELEAQVSVRHYGAAKYYDMLVDHADGNFRTLIEDVSKHPIMGKYLSHLKNQKAVIDDNGTPTDPSDDIVLISPDENYAREIMQLFSIGLLQLNPDGSIQLDGSTNLPLPTYTNEDITELARVFTGWSWGKKTTGSLGAYVESDVNTASSSDFNRGNGPKYLQIQWEEPMKNYPAFHDTDPKTFLGTTVPGGTDGETDLDNALDVIAGHSNVGPFLAKLMIQRMTTSNPSRGYLYRVADAFNGSGQGDFKAMTKAILLDYEARDLNIADGVDFGKQKEPMIRYIQLLRAFDGKSQLLLSDLTDPDVGGTAYPDTSWTGYPSGQFNNFPSDATRYRYGVTDTNLQQSPLRAPSVFNWFLPDYEPGGDVSAAGLVAPEMQITTETSAIYAINYNNTFTRSTVGQGVNNLLVQPDSNSDAVKIDWQPWIDFYNNSTTGTAAERAEQLVDQLDLLMCAGNLKLKYENAATPNPRSEIIGVVAGTTNGTTRVRDSIYLLSTTPEYIHQK